ncbi:hypothetical protein ACJO1Y_21480, partial [Vibrio parahaemolyticus]
DLQVIDLPIESNLVTYHFIYHKREKNNLHHKRIRNNIKETLKLFYKFVPDAKNRTVVSAS